MRVRLLYFPSCPNVDATRIGLRKALAACGLPSTFDETDIEAEVGKGLGLWGSPTILVDGQDLFGVRAPTGCACRIYPDPASSNVGVPSESSIVNALRQRTEKRSWIKSLLLLPAAVLPLLPAATCPFCIAAYAGVVSALGLGFLLNERIMLPLIVFFMAVSVATVGWTSRSHRRKGPLVTTVMGAAAVVLGRVALNVPVLVYFGVGLLVFGSAWNLWLKRPRRVPLVQLGSNRHEAS